MKYEGLRDWLSIIEQRGELTMLEDVDWNLEMGAVVDVLYREHPPYPPALIFDRIKDHKPGYRALFGHFASPQRIGLTLGVEDKFDHVRYSPVRIQRAHRTRLHCYAPLRAPRMSGKNWSKPACPRFAASGLTSRVRDNLLWSRSNSAIQAMPSKPA